jgi:multidrug efflux system membrane fusion protein
MSDENLEEQKDIPPPPPPPTDEQPSQQLLAAPKKSHWLEISLSLVVLFGLAYFFWAKSKPKNEMKRGPMMVPIEVDVARKGDIPIFVRALGTVTSLHSVNIVSQVQGQILGVHFKEGQAVKRGDLLVTIDPRPFQAALLQAQGQLDKDTSILKQATTNLARYKKAYEAHAVPEQQMSDQIQLVQQTRAAMEADRGAVANAKVNLQYCTITSPVDGQVGLRLVDPGNLVQANGGTQLAVVTQMEPITIIFSVAEDYVSQIQEQLQANNEMPVIALDRTQQKKIATGTFLAMDNQIDPSTGTVRVRATFENQDHSLFPNQFVNAKLLITTHKGVILVPSAAIQLGPQGAYVYVIESNQTAKMVSVKVETIEGEQTAVKGLTEGQQIAVNGFDKLQDGAHVKIRNSPQEKKGMPITRN